MNGEEKILQAIANMQTMMTSMQADLNTLKSDVSALKSDVSTLKSDVSTLKSDVSTLKSDVSALKSDVSTLKSDVDNLNTKVNDLTQSQLLLTAEVENRVEKLINGLYDGYKINAERFDKINFDSLKYNSEMALLLAKDNSIEIQKLKRTLEKIA